MDAVSLKLARNYTNEKLNSLPSNRPTKTVSFDGGIYSVGNDVVNGQVSDVVLKGLTATNLIKNGNFEEGLNNWIDYGVGSTGSIREESTEYAFLGNTSFKLVRPLGMPSGYGKRQYINTIPNHKYYAYGWGYISSVVDVSNPIGIIIEAPSTSSYFNLDLKDVWQRTSLEFIASLNSTTFILGSGFGLDKMAAGYFDGIVCIDLTSTFGAGKEPTIEQCDKMFANWFDGTKSTNSVRIRSVNEDETKESIAYVNLPQGKELRSLPNGVKDEISVSEGKLIKRVSEEAIINGDMFGSTLATLENTYQLGISNWSVGRNVLASTADSAIGQSADGSYKSRSSHEDIRSLTISTAHLFFRVEKTKIDAMQGVDTVAKFKAYFNQYPVTLIYQLAEPIVTKLTAQAPLQVFENGTVYVEPIGDPSETTLPTVELTAPIAGGNKVGIATHDYAGAAADWTLTNNESKCKSLLVTNAGGAANIIAPDKPGLTFTINNKSGQAITIKKSGGTGVTVTAGKKVTVQHFGTDYEAISSEI